MNKIFKGYVARDKETGVFYQGEDSDGDLYFGEEPLDIHPREKTLKEALEAIFYNYKDDHTIPITIGIDKNYELTPEEFKDRFEIVPVEIKVLND